MKPSQTVSTLLIAGMLALGGCASTSSSPYPYTSTTSVASYYGTIDSIQVTRASGSSGGGAIVGGVLGALVGNQIGSGSGRTAATVAGAAGGAIVGNQMEANRGHDTYQINVRLDNGGYQSVVQDSIVDLQAGQRVRIVDGRVYRY
jgi:outer membrane lipoprotein SlyB